MCSPEVTNSKASRARQDLESEGSESGARETVNGELERHVIVIPEG